MNKSSGDPFIKGIANSLPAAAITFDKFHAVKIVNDAVDQVRRAERKVHNVLAGTRYLWLRNPVNLSDRQRAAFENLPLRHLKTARAYRIRLAFQELYDQPTPDAATVFLKKWYFWATHSRLPPIIDAARTVKRHWNGILRGSTASSKPPKQRLAVTAQSATSKPWFTCSQPNSISCFQTEIVATHAKQRRTIIFFCPDLQRVRSLYPPCSPISSPN